MNQPNEQTLNDDFCTFSRNKIPDVRGEYWEVIYNGDAILLFNQTGPNQGDQEIYEVPSDRRFSTGENGNLWAYFRDEKKLQITQSYNKACFVFHNVEM